jgi:hypothetical protein
MSRAGFYSENEFRSYPFVNSNSGIRLPTESVVDFGCIMGPDANFEMGVHKIWLYQFTYIDNTFRFEFRSDAPGLTGRSLTFDFHEDDPEFTTRFATDDVSPGYTEYVSEVNNCHEEIKWEGYLVIGRVKYAAIALSNRVSLESGIILVQQPGPKIEWTTGSYFVEQVIEATNGSFTVDSTGLTVVEPALVQNLKDTYVKKIGLANKSRTTVTPPEECDTSSQSAYDGYYINNDCMLGDIKVKPGYNCNIFVNVNNNSITISGAVGEGEGQPCGEVPLYEGEVSPDGGALLSGGPQCKDVIKSINGITGRVVKIQGGLGVTIRNDDSPHTITVDPDHSNMALCGYLANSSSYSPG